MSPVKVLRVISCTSQDKVHNANNLLSTDGFKKWCTERPGVTKATVILQLESEITLRGVDIGNNGSAFVEVLVGKSSLGDDEKLYESLVVTSSFMTPSESRGGTNLYKMRIFSKDQLSNVTVSGRWDRIKIICTQPYNKTATFGLSVFTLHSDSVAAPAGPVRIGHFNIRSEPKDQKVLSVFKPAQTSQKAEIVSIEGKSASSLFSSLQNNNKSTSKEALERLKAEGDKKTMDTGLYMPRNVVDISDAPRPSSSHSSSSSSSSDPHPSSSNPSSSSKPALPAVPTDKILSNVVFVLSGFQNPYRADLRELGISLGAKYSPDWSTEATHLICSVPNTPKYNQVLGKGIIISKSWLIECRKQKRHVLEKRFRMDVSSESEEEEEEEEERKRRRSNNKDDERKKMKREEEEEANISDEESEKDEMMDLSVSENDTEISVDPYEAATDDESEVDVIKRLKLPPLPHFLSGHSFFFSPDVKQDSIHQLRRYIIGYGGRLNDHMSKDVRFVLTSNQAWSDEFNTALSNIKHLKFLNISWILQCNKQQCSVDKTNYYVTA